MIDVSVIILVGREERHIRRCLERLAPLEPRQVFVVESQKGDRTHEIAVETAKCLNWRIEECLDGDGESGALIERALPESTHHSLAPNFNSFHSNIQTFSHSNISLRAMGANGHALVESKYIWSAVVKAMIHGYEMLSNQQPAASNQSEWSWRVF